MYKTLGFKWLLDVFFPASTFATADRYEARNPQRFIHVTVIAQCKKPTAQMAHLVFSDTQANAQKTKRAIFCQRTDKQTDNNSNIFYLEKRDIEK